jgi:hypothetical protein
VPIATRLANCARAEESWHVLLIVAVSVAVESSFVHHGIAWLFDEGWPLYAAMQLHLGGVLYGDVFFLFPPGHLLPAWIAYALDPPGVILAREIYAAFSVSLCVAIYALGRKLMPPPFALLAALLLAVAAPRSHLAHLLFGYRYLVFSVVALLAFSARLRTGKAIWMFAAGVSTGVALCFRLTPAFAVSCGIGVAVMSATRDWRSWRRDWIAFALGLLLVTAPVLAWFASGVGLNALWEQAVLRILPLQAAQSKAIPAAVFPANLDRTLLHQWFVPVQYWLYPAMYSTYGAVLAWLWLRSVRARERFEHPLLLAVVIWGAIYMVRAIGRSDEHHLTSALPPICLLIAHLVSAGSRALRLRTEAKLPAAAGAGMRWAACGVVLAAWVVLQGSDLYITRADRGVFPLRSLDSQVRIRSSERATRIDRSVNRIARLTGPDQTVLDLTHAPLLHVLAGRRGPGYGDVVTPGVFADPADERAFVARLEQAPPELVLWPIQPFDGMPSRSLEAHAPLLTAWVRKNYVRIGGNGFREIAFVRRQ